MTYLNPFSEKWKIASFSLFLIYGVYKKVSALRIFSLLLFYLVQLLYRDARFHDRDGVSYIVWLHSHLIFPWPSPLHIYHLSFLTTLHFTLRSNLCRHGFLAWSRFQPPDAILPKQPDLEPCSPTESYHSEHLASTPRTADLHTTLHTSPACKSRRPFEIPTRGKVITSQPLDEHNKSLFNTTFKKESRHPFLAMPSWLPGHIPHILSVKDEYWKLAWELCWKG